VSTLKVRTRGAKFEAYARGKVYVFYWDPAKQVLSVRQKGSRRAPMMVSGDDLADAAEGQGVLFKVAAEAAPPKPAEPKPLPKEKPVDATPDMFAAAA
jgi:hypothetical protein